MDDGIADEEPAADQEGNGKNQKRFGEDLLCRFPEMYHQREEQKNASLYATEEYKPENRQTPASEGWSFKQTRCV